MEVLLAANDRDHANLAAEVSDRLPSVASITIASYLVLPQVSTEPYCCAGGRC